VRTNHLREGKDVSVITSGHITHEVIQAVDHSKKLGISVRLINMHTLKPIDKEVILEAASETKAILTVEEHSVFGGLGSAVADVLLQNSKRPVKFRKLGLNDIFPAGYGTYQEMKETNGLSKSHIIKEIRYLYRTSKKSKC